jgi:hypothetical protein
MPFNYKELVAKIEAFKDGEEGAWVVVLGCAPGSAKCPDGTQPGGQYALDQAIIYQDSPDATTSINLGFLQAALNDKLGEIKALKAQARKQEAALQKQMAGAKKAGGKGKEKGKGRNK